MLGTNLTLLLLAGVLGCGGGSSTTPSNTPQPIASNWQITLSQPGSELVLNVTFVATPNGGCSPSTLEQLTGLLLDVNGNYCFVADTFNSTGTINGIEVTGVVLGVAANPVQPNLPDPIDIVLFEDNPEAGTGALAVLNATGNLVNGTVQGSWVCEKGCGGQGGFTASEQ